MSHLRDVATPYNNSSFPWLHKVGNVGNKSSSRKEQSKLRKTKLPPMGIELGTLELWYLLG